MDNTVRTAVKPRKDSLHRATVEPAQAITPLPIAITQTVSPVAHRFASVRVSSGETGHVGDSAPASSGPETVRRTAGDDSRAFRNYPATPRLPITVSAPGVSTAIVNRFSLGKSFKKLGKTFSKGFDFVKDFADSPMGSLLICGGLTMATGGLGAGLLGGSMVGGGGGGMFSSLMGGGMGSLMGSGGLGGMLGGLGGFLGNPLGMMGGMLGGGFGGQLGTMLGGTFGFPTMGNPLAGLMGGMMGGSMGMGSPMEMMGGMGGMGGGMMNMMPMMGMMPQIPPRPAPGPMPGMGGSPSPVGAGALGPLSFLFRSADRTISPDTDEHGSSTIRREGGPNMAACPPTADGMQNNSQFRPYSGDPWWFHYGLNGYVENRSPTFTAPQNECFYDDSGALNTGWRGGSPNYFDHTAGPLSWLGHTFFDPGGPAFMGIPAFIESRSQEYIESQPQFGSTPPPPWLFQYPIPDHPFGTGR